MLLIYLDLASTLPWHSGWYSLLCLGMADIVGISLSWWEAWYLPPFYMDSSSTLYILEFLVADIAVYWILADGYSSAGRTGLGSAVLAGFIIGEELLLGLGLHPSLAGLNDQASNCLNSFLKRFLRLVIP